MNICGLRYGFVSDVRRQLGHPIDGVLVGEGVGRTFGCVRRRRVQYIRFGDEEMKCLNIYCDFYF